MVVNIAIVHSQCLKIDLYYSELMGIVGESRYCFQRELID